jgi:hypothetical protein
MTKDEIWRLAKEAGSIPVDHDYQRRALVGNDVIERFAALVAEKATEQANARQNASWARMCEKMVAAERELCAQVCEAEGQSPYATKHAAANIRARSKDRK